MFWDQDAHIPKSSMIGNALWQSSGGNTVPAGSMVTTSISALFFDVVIAMIPSGPQLHTADF